MQHRETGREGLSLRHHVPGGGQDGSPDPYTFKVLLKYSSASLPAQLATGWTSILPKHVVEAKGDMRRDLIGTGPFKLKGYTSSVSVELVKNPNYFVKGQPYLDALTFYLIKDRPTQFAAFRTGQAKLFSASIPLNKVDADLMRKQMPNAVIQPINRLKGEVFFMNANISPWNDVRVRRAVSLSWDRQSAIKVLGSEAGEIRASMLTGAYAIPKEELAQMPGFRQPKDADRAEAKSLLAEAGYANGFSTRILTRADDPQYVRLAEYAADQLKLMGIASVTDSFEGAVYLERKQRLEYSSMAITPVLDNADPDGAGRYFASPNESGFVDPEIDKLFAQQSQTIDPAERKKLVRQMEMRLIDQAWYVTSHWDENYLFAWTDLRNAEPKYLGANNNIRIVKDIWLAK
ncbi:MAG: ABC transporter substrate-binding protein [Chloroflexi bacterium]|nr:ABC transporter substrate-binding protein [Chloroflexota bacterium]